ncbi:CLOCK-interacting pacemaker isoform X1 [Arapaima gigas]
MSSKAKRESRQGVTTHVSDVPKAFWLETERDCSFSDSSSGYLSAVDQTDSEDASRIPGTAQTSKSGPQVAVVAGSYSNLSSMIIMNNVLLKQPNATAAAVKPWGFQPALEILHQPQVVFLQPVVSSNGRPIKAAGNKQRSRKYLPILKSYPKIAPYPGESSSEKSSSASLDLSSSASSHGGRHRPRRHRDKQQGCLMGSTKSVPLVAVSPRPVSPKQTHLKTSTEGVQALNKSCQSTFSQELTLCSGAPASPIPEVRAPSPCRVSVTPMSARVQLDVPSDGHSKRKRFCNTYNILHKSGLLGITLRTKELIRLNRHTQSQLEQLREHTRLFVEAMRSGDPQVWSKLQLAMLKTGSPGVEEQQEDEEKEKEEAQDSKV